MKKIIFIIIILLILTLVIGIGIKNSTNHVSAPTTNTQEVIYESAKTQETTPIFQYELKENYYSREEILAEREKLESAYYTYGNNVNREEFEKAEEIYDQLDSELFNLLYHFPPSDEEILQEKEYMLNMHVAMTNEDIYFLKERYKYTQTKDIEDKIADLEKKYTEELAIQKKYNDGEMTIDEALKALEIENSAQLKIYYDQIEVAKSNNN